MVYHTPMLMTLGNMRGAFLAFVVASWVVGGRLASADNDTQDVQALLRLCKAQETSAHCVGYISGIADIMMAVGRVLKNGPERSFLGLCSSASYSAFVQAFVNWAEQHPERWYQSRSIGVMDALREKWPCGVRSDNQ
jgi:hypothetical protein